MEAIPTGPTAMRAMSRPARSPTSAKPIASPPSLGKSGRVSIEKSSDAEGVWYSVEVRSDGRRSLDDILEAAWMNGASDAMTVRE